MPGAGDGLLPLRSAGMRLRKPNTLRVRATVTGEVRQRHDQFWRQVRRALASAFSSGGSKRSVV